MANGDELYSVTAVYYTHDVNGVLKIDYGESEDMQYFSVNNLPYDLTNEYRGYIEKYIKCETKMLD